LPDNFWPQALYLHRGPLVHRQVMANLATALHAAGAGIERLVSVLVMLVEGVDVQAAYAAPVSQRRPGTGD
jgi:hypothetical protein